MESGCFEGLMESGCFFTKPSLEMDLGPFHPGVKINHLRNPTEVDYV